MTFLRNFTGYTVRKIYDFLIYVLLYFLCKFYILPTTVYIYIISLHTFHTFIKSLHKCCVLSVKLRNFGFAVVILVNSNIGEVVICIYNSLLIFFPFSISLFNLLKYYIIEKLMVL